MLLDDLPRQHYVLDVETLVVALVEQRSNARINAIEGLVGSGRGHTTSRVRGAFNDYTDGQWNALGLQRLTVRNIDDALRAVASEMMDICSQNGIDLAASGITEKIFLIATARIIDGCVVTVDIRQTNISMSHLCSLFGIPVISFSDLG
jgi:hypothetical protein